MSIEIEGLSVAYGGTRVVHGFTLSVAPRSWIGLIGPNGAGKTTVLRAVGGHLPFDGDVSLLGEPASTISHRRTSRLIAFVPQRPVIPEAMTVLDYVLLGRTPYIPYLGTEGPTDVAIASRVIARLDLEPLSHRQLGSLSGGELQRAVLGRALAQEAPILLLDEPTAALDVGHQQQVLELIDRLRAEDGLTIVAAMHDLTLAGQFADRLALISRGRLVAAGAPDEVLTETTIRTYYDAEVRVLHDVGGIAVVPARAHQREVTRERT